MSEQESQQITEEPREPDITNPEVLAGEHPADVADAIEALSPEAGADVLEAMPPEAAADALEQMDEADAGEIIEDMEPAAAATALGLMALDDAADILAEMPPENRAQILRKLPEAHRAELEELLTYPPESAGGVMSPEVVALPANLTVSEAIAELRAIAPDSEQIYYTYVVDHQHRLVGVLSLRDLILAPEAACLHEILISKIVSVPATMDREEVASMLGKYGYYALPVVAEDNRLLGIVTIDDVVEILEDEATEDMQVMVGAGADERVDSPLSVTLARRLPWLMVKSGDGVHRRQRCQHVRVATGQTDGAGGADAGGGGSGGEQRCPDDGGGHSWIRDRRDAETAALGDVDPESGRRRDQWCAGRERGWVHFLAVVA